MRVNSNFGLLGFFGFFGFLMIASLYLIRQKYISSANTEGARKSLSIPLQKVKLPEIIKKNNRSPTVAIFFGSDMNQDKLLNLLSGTNYFSSISILSEFNPDQHAYNRNKLQVLKTTQGHILVSIPWWPFYDALLDADFKQMAQMLRLATEEFESSNMTFKLFAVEPFINNFDDELKRQLAGLDVFLRQFRAVGGSTPKPYSMIGMTNLDVEECQTLNRQHQQQQQMADLKQKFNRVAQNAPSKLLFMDRNCSPELKQTLEEFVFN